MNKLPELPCAIFKYGPVHSNKLKVVQVLPQLIIITAFTSLEVR